MKKSPDDSYLPGDAGWKAQMNLQINSDPSGPIKCFILASELMLVRLNKFCNLFECTLFSSFSYLSLLLLSPV